MLYLGNSGAWPWWSLLPRLVLLRAISCRRWLGSHWCSHCGQISSASSRDRYLKTKITKCSFVSKVCVSGLNCLFWIALRLSQAIWFKSLVYVSHNWEVNCLSFQVAKRREKLLNYMLFLRVTPTLPNTFINLASPIVDVPYHTFLLGTLIGLIPAAYVTVRVSSIVRYHACLPVAI